MVNRFCIDSSQLTWIDVFLTLKSHMRRDFQMVDKTLLQLEIKKSQSSQYQTSIGSEDGFFKANLSIFNEWIFEVYQ